jgi:hypothetical protein
VPLPLSNVISVPFLSCYCNAFGIVIIVISLLFRGLDAMNRVKLFSGSDVSVLEAEINGWLEENKDIRIVHSNLASFPRVELDGAEQGSERHLFYILYTKAKAARRKKHTAEEVAISESLASGVLPEEQPPAPPMSKHNVRVK